MSPTVTKTRTLHLTNPHQKGQDVKDAQELLHKHGYYKGAIDGEFGSASGNACKKAKFDLGYTAKTIKATYGYPLNGLLAGTIKLPAAYRIRQRIRRRKARRRLNSEAALRAKIVANANWMLSSKAKPQEHYQQLRPIDGEHHPYKLPLHFDCSGSVTDCYSWTGKVPDPNDEGYNGEGYTGTLLNGLLHIHASEVQPGDIGVYGAYPGDHAVLALTHGPDPVVFSMGHEGDPNRYRSSALLSIGPLQWLTARKW